MIIAGETSGDILAADLVQHLRKTLSQGATLEFFGAGGPKMSEAGVKLVVDLTKHAVTGLSDVLKKYTEFRKIFHQLIALAAERQPDVIILVDFGGFNLRFATGIRQHIRNNRNTLAAWSPKIVQFVSPQVWASRPGRAKVLEANVDLLLCLFPFEKGWYAKHAPRLRVDFVGHPILDRIGNESTKAPSPTAPLVLLLPGSRSGELKRHLPVMVAASGKIASANPNVRFRMVLPNARLEQEARALMAGVGSMEVRVAELAESLTEATLAIASTGTVLLECACHGVPTVAMYKTSWGTYQIGKHLITVRFLSMPNILADEEVYPEFIQDRANPENIANAVIRLLVDESQRQSIIRRLKEIVKGLGEPGAIPRAAKSIADLMEVKPEV